jgi:hypothetical protein
VGELILELRTEIEGAASVWTPPEIADAGSVLAAAVPGEDDFTTPRASENA